MPNVFEELLRQNREALKRLPVPPGLAEFVERLVASGDYEGVMTLLKLSYVLGVQQGVAQSHGEEESEETPEDEGPLLKA